VARRGPRLRQGSLACLVGLACVSLPGRPARACGSSGPDGVSACSLAQYAEEQRPKWRMGASGLFTSTVIRFTDSLLPGETRYAGLVEVAYAPTSRLSLSVGAGAGVGGKLLAPDGAHDFTPGVVTTMGVSYRFLEPTTAIGRFFLVGSAQVSFTGTATQLGNSGPTTEYDALDFRVGAAAGLTWLRRLSAYAVVRGFGGPVLWTYQGSTELGTDTHHYQVGGGIALMVFRHLELFAEGVPLGEQAIAAGASVPF
jgi:hypothetical protein